MTHAEEIKSSGLKATLLRIKILEIFQRSSLGALNLNRRMERRDR